MATFWDDFRSIGRAMQVLVQRREAVVVSRDRSGGWRQKFRQGVLVTPTLRAGTWRTSEADTKDVFLKGHPLKMGDVVVEVGAGCGTETVTLARLVGPTGRVIAVEAHPWTCALLRRTVEENGLSNVRVIQAAVCDRRGRVTISDGPPSHGITNSIVHASIGIEVEALSIDDLVRDQALQYIDFLKMNIEGAERAAVKGMVVSASSIGRAVISCHDFIADAGGDEDLRTREDVVRSLKELGFVVEDRRNDSRPWVRDYVYAGPQRSAADHGAR